MTRRKEPTLQGQRVEGAFQAVWSALSEQQWLSIRELECTGVPKDTLMSVIGFLVRWQFAETERFPMLHVRRKSGTMPPAEVVEFLRIVSENSRAAPKRTFRIAERVACRVCGSRSLRMISINEVECSKCYERQWHAIDVESAHGDEAEVEKDEQPDGLQRVLIRLGFPRFAFVRWIPKPTRFYYFWCNNCKRISDDYAHGHSRYFTCSYCGQTC